MSDEKRAKVEADAERVWENILNATKAQWSYCPTCRSKVQADFPDFVNQAKALEVFADQTFGKVPTTHHVEVDYGEKTLEVLRAMPMSELARYAAIDAEWDEVAVPELPPAA